MNVATQTGMGASWTSAAESVIRGVLASIVGVPAVAALSAIKQTYVAAILDLPAQRDRINREIVTLDAAWEKAKKNADGEIADPAMARQWMQWQEQLNEAYFANDKAMTGLNAAVAAARAAGVYIPSVSMSGLGIAPALVVGIGVAAAVIIVGGGWAGSQLYEAWAKSQVHLEYARAYGDAYRSGKALPGAPAGAASATEAAISGLVTLGGIGIAGYLLLSYFSGRRRT